ncbi:MAG: hypothetical protein ACP5UV_05920 [Thermoplasmata archaeon]
MAMYLAIFVAIDILIPTFLPKYTNDVDFIPFFFFFPFFMFGRRSWHTSDRNGNPSPADDDKKGSEENQSAYNYEDYDEYGIIKRRNDTRILYLIGAVLIAIAVIIIIFKMPLL